MSAKDTIFIVQANGGRFPTAYRTILGAQKAIEKEYAEHDCYDKSELEWPNDRYARFDRTDGNVIVTMSYHIYEFGLEDK